MNNPIDGTDGKLGHGFTSADELEEVDIRFRDRPRPTYVSAKLDPEYKRELIDLLKEFNDCFAWEYYEMPGLDRSIVEHRLPIKPGFGPLSKLQGDSIRTCLMILKRRLKGYWRRSLSDHADMQSGYRMLSLYTRRMEN